MSSASQEATVPLIFRWEPPRRRRVAITGFLIGSALIHAFCFYVFQIVYPPAVVLLPPPARVSLIAPNSEEGRSLLRWIEAEDPALVSATQRPPEAKARALPKLQHVPSYLAQEPALKEIPPPAVDLRLPSTQPPGPVAMRRAAVPPAPVASGTRVTFSSELNGFGHANFPPANFTAAPNQLPETARFRVAVNQYGEVQFCFALVSSGDAALDEQARQYLALARFSQKPKTPDGSLVWATATVEWGNDVAPPGPAAQPAHTP